MDCDLAALISVVCSIKSVVQGWQDIGHKAFTRNLLGWLSMCAIFGLVNVALLPKGTIQQLYLMKWKHTQMVKRLNIVFSSNYLMNKRPSNFKLVDPSRLLCKIMWIQSNHRRLSKVTPWRSTNQTQRWLFCHLVGWFGVGNFCFFGVDWLVGVSLCVV